MFRTPDGEDDFEEEEKSYRKRRKIVDESEEMKHISQERVRSASTTLMAMNFMNRKNADHHSKERIIGQNIKLNVDFETPLAHSVLTKMVAKQDASRLQCTPASRAPEGIILGRRSFGGFNRFVETAYLKSVVAVEEYKRKQKSSRQTK